MLCRVNMCERPCQAIALRLRDCDSLGNSYSIWIIVYSTILFRAPQCTLSARGDLTSFLSVVVAHSKVAGTLAPVSPTAQEISLRSDLTRSKYPITVMHSINPRTTRTVTFFTIAGASQTAASSSRTDVMLSEPLEQRMINAFKMDSVRQVGFGVGDKLVDGIGNIVYLKWIRAALKVGVAQHMKAAF